jgi:acyl-CoA dehydrogenase
MLSIFILSVKDAVLLKLFITEMAGIVVDDCLQMLSGYGDTAEYPISGFYRDVRIGRIWGRTSESMREVIALSILGR